MVVRLRVWALALVGWVGACSGGSEAPNGVGGEGGGRPSRAVSGNGALDAGSSAPADGSSPDPSAAGGAGGAGGGGGALDPNTAGAGAGGAGGDAATSAGGAGGVCADCTAGVCERATCGVDTGCAITQRSDGSACGANDENLCVAGRCVEPGCGNGYRELAPDREACDDGNVAGGDACSASCEPTVLVVASRAGGVDWSGGPAPAVGIDGMGRALFLWLAEIEPTGDDAEPTWELRARRYTSSGVRLDEADTHSTLAAELPVGWNVQPSVAGLDAGGWVVTWHSPRVDDDLGGIALRVVDSDGTLRDPVAANQQQAFEQHSARVAALGEGFVVVWVDDAELEPGDDRGGLRARLFDSDATPVSSELVVPSATAGDQREPAIAVADDVWMVAWTEQPVTPASRPAVRARRFRGEQPLDASDMSIAVDALEPAATGLAEGSFVLAWTSLAADDEGDIHTLPIPSDTSAATDAPDVLAATPAAERLPSIAANAAGALVAWQTGGTRRGIALDGPGSVAAAKARLAQELTDHEQGEVALTPTPRGAWLVWSDARELPSGPRRSVLAYWLPSD